MKNSSARVRTGFTFYRSFSDAIRLLNSRDQLTLFRAIADYALDQRHPDINAMSRTARICWITILPNLVTGIEGFRNGCKGGAPKGNSNARKTPAKQPQNNLPLNTGTNNGNVDGYVDGYVDEDVERVSVQDKPADARATFVKPTIEEVRDYISLKDLKADAASFVDYYTANGWRVGRSPMRDWHAALRNWARRDYPTTTQKQPNNEPPRPVYQAL